MPKRVKHSVTKTIAKSMLLIVLLSLVTTNLAIVTLASSINDAEAINVAGSMRMQSYRLGYDIETDSDEFSAHIDQFERSIYSSSMKQLQKFYVPDDITQDYYRLISRWHQLKTILNSDDQKEYAIALEQFVSQIDDFVFKLQTFSERKLIILAWVGGLGLSSIFLVSVFVVRYVRKEIVRPLHSLVSASEQIKNRTFNVLLDGSRTNEMGILNRAFNQMAIDLDSLYKGLEKAVNEKTHKLQHANLSLEVLYKSSQELTASRITHDNFEAILFQISNVEGIKGVRLEISQPGERNDVLEVGHISCSDSKQKSLQLDGVHLGTFYWQSELPCPDQALIDNFVHILSRAIYYNQAQQQSEQLLIMEERATIARELHDSLAQSLSYLKIQVTLLKKVLAKQDPNPHTDKINAVISELHSGVSEAYTQLRELLTTFRLTLNEGSFGLALQEMLVQLGEQTDAKIHLDNQLSTIELEANQQVHLIQLIREATLNSIKHAHATKIDVECIEQDNTVTVSITDDGIGYDKDIEKLNHYGMAIMHERASRLNGHLEVRSIRPKGCAVVLTYQRS
ncbi:nitrate/nitrite two-component system sensor histidine kinase NarQ [Vibrio genomosp. F10]|uniref:nitrate/nitrite two-component system sensor histidine kinase NarQ n=2 Tax=Vibrio genomosp. F10 TaxID=723171 RepID=UPI0002DDB820|nr:nitrate/nitrite two-component system sensor histidine kinase NarQ [Vibrio genomosp. F10]OEE91640.1 two-component system sensor histidine kinase NarQ [Vibrio genomosp. F10 str. 9ZD137]OEF10620.1 two-component system sensor histidine kinase NarQ [Vibrio genomosp. F10 str. 9ZB36]